MVGALCGRPELTLLLLPSPEPLSTMRLMCPLDHVAWRLLCMGELSSAPSPSPCPSWRFETVAYETDLQVLSSALANHESSQASFYLFEICKSWPLAWSSC